MSPINPKIKILIPSKEKQDKRGSAKHKVGNRLNISDFLVQKKKKLSKNISQKFGDIINANGNTNRKSSEDFIRKVSFIPKSQIKKDFLKDYKEQKKAEKKYRKIKITKNLSDSSEEESEENDENIKLELYISSESHFILFFDIILALCTFYVLFHFPINRAERKNYVIKENKINAILNIITEVIYILDLCIGFFRSYYDFEYKKVIDTNKIIINYLTGDFFMDLLEALPSYMICKYYYYKNTGINIELSGFEIFLTILQILKSFKMLKVLNVKSNRAFEILHDKISKSFYFENLFNLLIFLFKIFAFLHILICIHIFLGWQRYPNWMVHINIIDENLIIKYICSFYFIL